MSQNNYDKEGTYRVTVPSTDGGINLSKLSNKMEDSCLSKAVNMVLRNGAFVTRSALTATEEDVFFDEQFNPNWDTEYIVTDTFVTVSGKRMKILYVKETDLFSLYIFHIYFLAADGTKIKAGDMFFQRTSETSFFEPVNILFFSGAPVSGGGIFAMITRQNLYDETEKSYQIFEISANLQSWVRITDFFVPTVLINGRGSSYEYSRSCGIAFTGTPKILESKNILNGGFTAYYTSDRYSSSFRLPFTNLRDCTVSCRVYAASDIYTDWVIEPSENKVTAQFFSIQLTLTIDRSKGILTFSDPTGADYAFERFGRYSENNIRVTSSQFCEEDFNDIVSSTCCAECGSKLVFSGGNKPNRIFSVDKKNPLYFSEGSSSNIDEDSKIIAMIPAKSGILAFTSDKVYAVRLIPGKAINSHALLADDASYFYEQDTFSYSTVTNASGCIGKNGVLLSGKTPLWIGTDRKLHLYKSSQEKEESISEKIDPFLKELSEEEFLSCAVTASEDQLLFMFQNKALLLEYHADFDNHGKPAKWYLLDFGNIRLKGGVTGNGVMRVICSADQTKLLYSAKLEPGQNDIYFDLSDYEPTAFTSNISSSFSTKDYDFGKPQIRKFIDSIQFSATCEGTLEVLLNKKPLERLHLTSQSFGNGTKSVRIHPHIRPATAAALTFSSNSPFSVSDIMFTYREEA